MSLTDDIREQIFGRNNSPLTLPYLPDLPQAEPGVPAFDKNFNTILNPVQEQAFQGWKAKNAPNDSGDDYDLRGTFKEGLTRNEQNGHFSDKYKKPNHPTFSNESQYAQYGNPGHWEGETFVPPAPAVAAPIVSQAASAGAAPAEEDTLNILSQFTSALNDVNLAQAKDNYDRGLPEGVSPDIKDYTTDAELAAAQKKKADVAGALQYSATHTMSGVDNPVTQERADAINPQDLTKAQAGRQLVEATPEMKEVRKQELGDKLAARGLIVAPFLVKNAPSAVTSSVLQFLNSGSLGLYGRLLGKENGKSLYTEALQRSRSDNELTNFTTDILGGSGALVPLGITFKAAGAALKGMGLTEGSGIFNSLQGGLGFGVPTALEEGTKVVTGEESTGEAVKNVVASTVLGAALPVTGKLAEGYIEKEGLGKAGQIITKAATGGATAAAVETGSQALSGNGINIPQVASSAANIALFEGAGVAGRKKGTFEGSGEAGQTASRDHVNSITDAMLGHETHGTFFTADGKPIKNAEGSGATGGYQIMPKTFMAERNEMLGAKGDGSPYTWDELVNDPALQKQFITNRNQAHLQYWLDKGYSQAEAERATVFDHYGWNGAKRGDLSSPKLDKHPQKYPSDATPNEFADDIQRRRTKADPTQNLNAIAEPAPAVEQPNVPADIADVESMKTEPAAEAKAPVTSPLDGTPHTPAKGEYVTEEPVVARTKRDGTTEQGVVAKDLTPEQVSEITNRRPVPKDDGFFIEEKHISRPEGFEEPVKEIPITNSKEEHAITESTPGIIEARDEQGGIEQHQGTEPGTEAPAERGEIRPAESAPDRRGDSGVGSTSEEQGQITLEAQPEDAAKHERIAAIDKRLETIPASWPLGKKLLKEKASLQSELGVVETSSTPIAKAPVLNDEGKAPHEMTPVEFAQFKADQQPDTIPGNRKKAAILDALPTIESGELTFDGGTQELKRALTASDILGEHHGYVADAQKQGLEVPEANAKMYGDHNQVAGLADFITGKREDIEKLQSDSSQLEHRIDKVARQEPYVPIADRAKSAKRGGQAIIDRLTLEVKKENLPIEHYDAITDFIKKIGRDMFDDVAISMRKHGPTQGLYDFGRNIVSIFRENVLQSGGNISHATIHELFHSLSRFVPAEHVEQLRGQYFRERGSYLKQHPEMATILGKDTISKLDGDNWLKNNPGKSVYLTLSDYGKEYTVNYDDKNYRYKNLDEFFAEKLTDNALGKMAPMPAGVRGLIAKGKQILHSMIESVQGLFGYNATAKIAKNFDRGNYDQMQRETPLESDKLFKLTGHFALPDFPSNKFSDPQVQESIDREKDKELTDTPDLLAKIAEKFETFKNNLTRDFANLPRTGKFALANFDIHQLERVRETADAEVFLKMREALKGLDPNQYAVFENHMIVRDAAESIDIGKQKMREERLHTAAKEAYDEMAASDMKPSEIEAQIKARRLDDDAIKERRTSPLTGAEAPIEAEVKDFFNTPENVPHYMTDDFLQKEVPRYNELVKSDDRVQKAADDMRQVMKDFSGRLVDAAHKAGRDPGFTREEYMPHVIFDKKSEMGYFGGGNGGSPFGRKAGYAQPRTFEEEGGERRAYSPHVGAAFYDVLGRVAEDTKRLEIYNDLFNEYSIAPRLVAEFGKEWRDHIPGSHQEVPIPPGSLLHRILPVPHQVVLEMADEHLKNVEGMTDDLRDAITKALGGSEAGHALVVPKELASTLIEITRAPKMYKPLAAAVRSWKIWQLSGPTRFFKYNVRNLTGDFEHTIIGNPSTIAKVPEAIKNINDVMVRNQPPSAEMAEHLKRGLMQSLTTVQEDIIKSRQFKDFYKAVTEAGKPETVKSAVMQYLKHPIKGAGAVSDYRESILRHAAFLDYLDQIKRNGKPDNYGASLRDEVDALVKLDRPEDAAYKLSNDLLGAYDEVTEVGKFLRKNLYPFWSWQEVNAKFYKRVVMNAIHDNASMGKLGKLMGQGALSIGGRMALKAGMLGLKLVAFEATVRTFNQLTQGKNEDDLPYDVQKRPHLDFFSSAGGTVFFDRIGASADALSWFGMDDTGWLTQQVLLGRMSVKDALKTEFDPKNAALNIGQHFASGLGPGYALYDVALGVTNFPDPFSPRPVRDRKAAIAQIFGLEKIYNTFSGKPNRGIGNLLLSQVAYQVDPKEAAWNDMKQFAAEYMQSKGRGSGPTGYTDASNNLHWAVQAAKYGDQKGFEKFFNNYANIALPDAMALAGGDPYLATGAVQKKLAQTLRSSIESMVPDANIPSDLKADFFEQLSKQPLGMKKFQQAMEHYYESKDLITGSAPPTSAFRKELNRPSSVLYPKSRTSRQNRAIRNSYGIE